jgi:hypothetical protein
MTNPQSLAPATVVRRLSRVLSLLPGAAALLLAANAHAASFTVMTFGDPFAVGRPEDCTPVATIYCSLRSAIAAANAADPGQWNTIYLKEGNYVLNNALPSITGAVMIRGAGSHATAVLGPCGTSVTRDPGTGHCSSSSGEFRVFQVASGGKGAFFDLTIRGGFGPAGAGVLNQGWLEMHRVTVMGNTAHQGAGGIWNDRGHLNLLFSTVRDNSSHHGPAGGIVNGRIFQDRNARGTHVNEPLSFVEIYNSTISGNTVHGGDFGYDGYAGGIANGGLLAIDTSTISGNRVVQTDSTDGAGGILNLGQGNALVTHLGEVWLASVTIAANDGGLNARFLPNAGGVENIGGKFHLANTIIAGNVPDGDRDCFGELITLRGNLIGDLGKGLSGKADCRVVDWAGLPNLNTRDQIGTPEGVPLHWNTFVPSSTSGISRIPVLANNGGLTCTHALCSGSGCFNTSASLARNRGWQSAPGAFGACSATDQRGGTRKGCDVGAFEVDAPPPSTRADLQCSGLK